MRRVRERGPRRILFFGLVLMPFLLVFPYLRAVNNPNEFVRVFTSMAIVEKQTFAIDEEIELWGWINDQAHIPSKFDGKMHHYMVKGPLLGYLGVPGYFVFSKGVAPLLGRRFPTAASTQEERLWWLRASTWALRITTLQIPCFVFLLWFERYLRAFTGDRLLRYIAVAAAGLGSNFLAYTHMFASHSLYAVFAFVAFALVEREYRLSRGDALARRSSRAFIAGFCTSACVALEYQALFPAIILSVYALTVFYRPTRLVAFALGGLANVPAVMFFQWRAYGDPLTPGHKMLESQGLAAAHKQGLWGILWPTWDHLSQLAFSPAFGFFGMSPFMILGLFAIPYVLLRPMGGPTARSSIRRAVIVHALLFSILIGVQAGFVEWRAGWTVGPRYLVPCAPFFAFAATLLLERYAGSSLTRRALVRGAAGGLALASILTIGTVGLLYDTLPEAIQRPFTQFSLPMMQTGFVPHHVGQWFGWSSTTLWYIACAGMLLTALVAGLWPIEERRLHFGLRAGAFVLACGAGMIPAFTPSADASPHFVLHTSVRGFPLGWEPAGRDRIARLREDAERYGPRRPCMWFRLADLDRVIGNEAQAVADERRAQVSRESARCPRTYF